jgi:hypothetical protein
MTRGSPYGLEFMVDQLLFYMINHRYRYFFESEFVSSREKANFILIELKEIFFICQWLNKDTLRRIHVVNSFCCRAVYANLML